jgi:para-nitrobenzyl esterase
MRVVFKRANSKWHQPKRLPAPPPVGSESVPLRSPLRRAGCAIAAIVVVVTLLSACGRSESATPSTSAQQPSDPAIVQTKSGAVRGLVVPDHRLFAGIPYAAPPVGPLRWQPPAPPLSWPGVRDASHPGARCIQDSSHDPDFGRSTSEDCLTLNVWTPPAGSAAEDRLPVMVWIHGGAFVNGSGDIYNARTLTTRGGIIVVTLNYRLGALGFLAHPALGPGNDVGNYGLADQQAALRWVRDNIASFGGDPGKVTIAGESAGGMSVCDHLVAPGSAGLFRAAIIQSGPCQAQANLATAAKTSLDYAATVGCGNPATAARCLRALPPAKLIRVPWYYRFGNDSLTGPVTGTAVLPVDPLTAFAQGRAARVPVLIGTNHDEFTLFVAMQYLHQARAHGTPSYSGLLADTYGPDAGTVGARYPVERYGHSVPLAYAASVTDSAFACVADRIADGLARTTPVYAYEFNDRNAPAPDPLRGVSFPVGASHSLELQYLFNMGDVAAPDAAQRRLSDQMVAYWTRFVTTGSPRAAGQPDWPKLGTDAPPGERMSLQPDGSRVATDFDASHQCAFWAGLKRS